MGQGNKGKKTVYYVTLIIALYIAIWGIAGLPEGYSLKNIKSLLNPELEQSELFLPAGDYGKLLYEAGQYKANEESEGGGNDGQEKGKHENGETGAEDTYEMGDKIGSVTIEKLNIKRAPLYYGTDSAQLSKGICVCEKAGGWQFFGERGRTLLSCHNDREFRHLDELEIGDAIHVFIGSKTFSYEVIGMDISYLSENTWAEKAYYATPEYGLTLSTCYPYRTKIKDKWIVNCKFQKKLNKNE